MTTQTTRQPTILDALPKAELHLHLEGSIRPETAVELAARHGVKLTAEEVVARYNYSNFAGFIEAFKWVTSFLREPEDYALITRKLAEELVRQNVVYAEITISAGVMLRRMQNVEANFMAIRETAESVPFSRLRRVGFSTRRGNSAPSGHGGGALRRQAHALGRDRIRNGRRRTCLPGREFPSGFRSRAQRRIAHRVPRGRNRRS